MKALLVTPLMAVSTSASFSLWSDNTLVNVVLFLVYSFLFGWFFTLGQRVGNKLP